MENNTKHEKLDVEGEDSREKRLQSLLERMSTADSTTPSSTSSPPISGLPSIGFGDRTIPKFAPNSELLGRIQAFLPQLEASNRALLERAQADPSSVDIENVKDGEERYIEMNLGLGVYEERQRSRRRRTAPQSNEGEVVGGEGSFPVSRETEADEDEMDEEESESNSDSDSSSDLDSTATTSADPVSTFFKSLQERRKPTSSGSSSSSSTTTTTTSSDASDSGSDSDSDSDSDFDSDSSSNGPTIPVSERLIKPLPKRTRKPPLIEVIGEAPTTSHGGDVGTENVGKEDGSSGAMN